MGLVRKIALTFSPADFIIVMATGISSDILYVFPYSGFWLRRASYPMFAVACLSMLYFQILCLLHLIFYIKENSLKAYFNEYFRNPNKALFWGAYPMGLVTIINYMVNLVVHDGRITHGVKMRMIRTCYVLWWFDVGISLWTAWGINFFILKSHFLNGSLGKYQSYSQKIMTEQLKSMILFPIIPIVVACSSSANFTMLEIFSETFNRRIQFMTLIVTTLLWLHALALVFMLITIFFWNLYVNKIPPMTQAFSLFIVLGPLGQASFGILLLTNDAILYVNKYYHLPTQLSDITTIDDLHSIILTLSIPWMFKAIGLILGLTLLGFGYYYTIFSILSFIYYSTKKLDHPTDKNKKIRLYHFNKGWWGMTFPMGTMSLGSTELYHQFNEYVPMKTFRVLGTIYGTVCILWSINCVLFTLYFTVLPFIKNNIVKPCKNKDESIGESPMILDYSSSSSTEPKV
ncbi:hypothetical protein TBLA_0H03790 [Henningerozyma blattae CBS 6284]|uniref:Sulfite efflux pump SSU1 n=1 Tax=Henningerozyma blattae (strain ATCC 34711 / CBS 6284 / DSM 70876 / NBRC 10599 / NRRL Y-10934 / UCD 77-7) TaxID=1071380 RepID=I2H8F8_HENB6|nr:hypothetical protein TBLA_0H03790 [Tetrapisispora blattae CBS 6284]CCH62660.1 hypothetical protein TBLA_0H03790 [Tetrapisispora blattae CBS 6284]